MTDIADTYRIDKARVKDAFSQASKRYDDVAVLQKEVCVRMLQRLDLVRLTPERILDVGAGTGRASRALTERYSNARLVALDLALPMLQQARGATSLWQRWRGRQAWVCGDAESLPVSSACMDLLFSNLTLQWCNNLDAVFAEFHRVLRPGGLLMFSSFGPDTLKELRQSWQRVDNYTHVNAFIDMHDVGDALMRAGFSDPVLDVEHFTLTYPDVTQLMRELKAVGAHNVTAGRPRGLMSPRKLQAVSAAYESLRREGVLPCTYEVLYAHAWMPTQPRQRQEKHGEVRIPIQHVQRGNKSP